MLISFIIPVYNAFPYLEHCVRSILQQSYRKIEVILIDDGSTDGSVNLIKEKVAELKEKGIDIANVTLHVGIGTFRPVKVEKVEEHHMHSEHFYIKKEVHVLYMHFPFIILLSLKDYIM